MFLLLFHKLHSPPPQRRKSAESSITHKPRAHFLINHNCNHFKSVLGMWHSRSQIASADANTVITTSVWCVFISSHVYLLGFQTQNLWGFSRCFQWRSLDSRVLKVVWFKANPYLLAQRCHSRSSICLRLNLPGEAKIAPWSQVAAARGGHNATGKIERWCTMLLGKKWTLVLNF